jgi:hypothetical protein
MHFSMICVVLCYHICNIQFVTSDHYIVSLYAPDSDSTTSESYIIEHLQDVQSLLHGDFVTFTYWNLAKWNFYAYAISIGVSELDILRRMADVKFVERVGEMVVASNNIPGYIPFNYLRPEVPALTHEGYCTVDYDVYRKHVNVTVPKTLPTVVSTEMNRRHIESNRLSECFCVGHWNLQCACGFRRAC